MGCYVHGGNISVMHLTVPTNGASIKNKLVPLGLTASRIPSSLFQRKTLMTCIKSAGAIAMMTSDSVPSQQSSERISEEKKFQFMTFPHAFESFIVEVCDETEISEVKLRIGVMEMHLKRSTGPGATSAQPVQLPSSLSEPFVESSSPMPLPVHSTASTPTSTNPFKNVSPSNASMLADLEALPDAYVVISSPAVGTFWLGRMVERTQKVSAFEQGDMITKGQIIGFVNQLGSEIAVKSDVAGEVIKLLHTDEEAVGYGDPIMAVLPSFQGIK